MDVSCPDNYADGHFDEVKHLHKPAVFLESEKGKWLEKVLPFSDGLLADRSEEDTDE